LLKVTNPTARAFYELEAARESWSSRELERQVASFLFERLARSRDKKKVMALARRGHQVETPADVIKEPFVLEFLSLDERSEWRERELVLVDLKLGKLTHQDLGQMQMYVNCAACACPGGEAATQRPGQGVTCQWSSVQTMTCGDSGRWARG
jgi:predicted nuclease of restriction endonuclease-like (RecB) superfamily